MVSETTCSTIDIFFYKPHSLWNIPLLSEIVAETRVVFKLFFPSFSANHVVQVLSLNWVCDVIPLYTISCRFINARCCVTCKSSSGTTFPPFWFLEDLYYPFPFSAILNFHHCHFCYSIAWTLNCNNKICSSLGTVPNVL